MPTPRTSTATAIASLLLLGGCSSSPMSAIGSITGQKSVSESDRVFLMAAGSWDRNRDNVVTCDEWKAYATELFNGADANRDESIEASEWSRIVAVDRMFETANGKFFDANGDGKVTRAEFVEKQNPAFRLMDTEKKCALNGAQVAGARSKTEFDVSGKPPPSPETGEDKAIKPY